MSLLIFILIKALMIILMFIFQKTSLNIFVNFSLNHYLNIIPTHSPSPIYNTELGVSNTFISLYHHYNPGPGHHCISLELLNNFQTGLLASSLAPLPINSLSNTSMSY